MAREQEVLQYAMFQAEVQNQAARGIPPAYMTPEQYIAASNAGVTYGSGFQGATAESSRIFPRGYRVLTTEIGSGFAFLVSGPFAPITAIYMRNSSTGVYGVYMDDPVHPITVGPDSERRAEFDTPTDTNGRVSSMVLTIVELQPPAADEEPQTLFIEVE